MLYAEKGNKLLSIEDGEKNRYQALGFDIVEIDGKKKEVLAHGHGKKVDFEAYQKLQKENETLKKKLAEANRKAEANLEDAQPEKKTPAKEAPKK